MANAFQDHSYQGRPLIYPNLKTNPLVQIKDDPI